ncbi:MAG: GIY-YIG nuclease family protein [Alphaproteobacteria bacterium]|nr:GIY-YIG nuclease family protein [Alphaproteobacteria bacterium]
MGYYVYMMASKRNGTLYIGVTRDLAKRAYEHKSGAVPGFTRKYGVKTLVYFEEYGRLLQARDREARMKKWKRDWKIRRIEELNPRWEDLYEKINA